MGKILPLPKHEELPEVVLFHRTSPGDPRLLLQVPTGAEEAETYVVRLDRIEHKQWFDRLLNSRALTDRLAYEMHVAYYPTRNGTVMTLEDPDEIPWVCQVLAAARMQHNSQLGGYFNQRNARKRALPAPALKRALSARGGAQW
jgi:hypothetical protein